jgi:[ribosomal protein S18]-alanine N-acetyltransferase
LPGAYPRATVPNVTPAGSWRTWFVRKDTSILATRYRIEPMDQTDVSEVSRVERRCFDNPWPASAYRRELRNTRQNYYVVLRVHPEDEDDEFGVRTGGQPRLGESILSRLPAIHLPHLPRRSGVMSDRPHIAGFAGMWSVYDEAHITTIGVDPHYRGRGFGELLLMTLFDEAIRRGANWITLEVRVSNHSAQRLYLKYGMSIRTTRPRYYSDNGEDAHVMWSRSLRDAEYLRELDSLRTDLRRRMGPEIEVPDQPETPWDLGGRF